jgi:hypothetical protein
MTRLVMRIYNDWGVEVRTKEGNLPCSLIPHVIYYTA